MSQSRLDKLLALSGERTRSEAQRLIRAGRLTVDGIPVTDPAHKADPDRQTLLLDGAPFAADALQYLMLHKPAGVLTAARDSRQQTVMDLLPERMRLRGVLPVGRLDKDTTGLLLLTNDGPLCHALLAPRRHVDKLYLAEVDGPLTEDDIAAFAQGLPLGDFTALPAQLDIVESAPERALARVTVREGKFHQIKRMFASRGRTVTRLSRLAFGPLTLPEELAPGQWRPLTPQETALLQKAAAPKPREDKP